jgi:hypothetical protein
VNENITWQGLFHSGSQDSLMIKLEVFKSFKELPGGIRQTTTIPPDTYLKNSLPGNGLKPFALDDIGFSVIRKGQN